MSKNVEQSSTNNGTTNTVYTSTQIIANNGDEYTLSNCIPTNNSTIMIDNVSKIFIPGITSSKHKTQSNENTSTNTETPYQNQNIYPKVLVHGNSRADGRAVYNYEIQVQSEIMNAINEIKKSHNIPSAYNRLELNKLFHQKFNRFRIEYPDYFLNGTLAYVVMTRPDLNLFSSASLTFDDLTEQVKNDPQMLYIARADLETMKTLTKAYSSTHHFNPLLSNTLTSLDISDETIDTLETGETFTGFKTQYAKSNIRSMTAGTINLKFPETYNMAITHAHQVWCSYESNVYRGSMKPKYQYIWKKELDYACDIYYFLLDKQDMIIRYWCKYTGCFPLNVNKSVFSYDVGTELNHPELSVTYAYFAREDMSITTLNEFNNNSGGMDTNFKYKTNYSIDKGVSGNTWSGAPFVEEITQLTGCNEDAKLYALRFRN